MTTTLTHWTALTSDWHKAFFLFFPQLITIFLENTQLLSIFIIISEMHTGLQAEEFRPSRCLSLVAVLNRAWLQADTIICWQVSRLSWLFLGRVNFSSLALCMSHYGITPARRLCVSSFSTQQNNTWRDFSLHIFKFQKGRLIPRYCYIISSSKTKKKQKKNKRRWPFGYKT